MGNLLFGNKGEWSEVFAFFKLLGEGQLYSADAYLKRKSDVFYNIVEILRNEGDGNIRFIFNPDLRKVTIEDDFNRAIKTIAADDFSKEAEYLFSQITSSKKRTFTVQKTQFFLNSINCKKLKAPSVDKSDIKIKVHDSITKLEPTLGFSIKSMLGKPSTLLNAGRTTNFIYKIKGSLYDNTIIIHNSTSSENSYAGINEAAMRERLGYLNEEGYCLEYFDMENKTFKNNLTLIDSELPRIIAYMLIQYYFCKRVKLIDALAAVSMINPLGYDLSEGHNYYEYKLKKFLTESALGMLPATVWTGKADANGGYIIVKEDGDLLCYHLYNRNDFEEYLLRNTKFEQASTGRHKYGYIYNEDGETLIKLNLQIRFTS